MTRWAGDRALDLRRRLRGEVGSTVPRALAARGGHVHGEAEFVTGLVVPPARVLGTGRVAIRLAELGYDVVGVDLDASMLAMANEEAPHLVRPQPTAGVFTSVKALNAKTRTHIDG